MAWKVVTKKSNRSFAIDECSVYSLHYCRGKIVEAPENTLGIFCFKRKIQAKRFASAYRKYFSKIIKVKVFGKGIIPEGITYCSDLCLTTFYSTYNHANVDIFSPPVGTICYKKILVLE